MSAIVRYIFNFNVPHPLKSGKGVLTDYNIAALMLPMIVVGSSVGVIVNRILPAVVIAAILFLLLSGVIITTIRKWCKMIAEEREKFGPVCSCSNKKIPKGKAKSIEMNINKVVP